MINKKNVLGKTPQNLGEKDAVHVAIVSVRAGENIKPGTKCVMNEFNEAIPAPHKKAVGVADPWTKSDLISKGQNFLLLLNQDEIPNVQHTWEHPNVDFSPPKRPIEFNQYLVQHAKDYGITYDQLMDACATVVRTYNPVLYPGTKSQEEIEKIEDLYDLFAEWSNETGHEFENFGSYCCPEYQYPDELFYFKVED